jgi:hypothetical protein
MNSFGRCGIVARDSRQRLVEHRNRDLPHFGEIPADRIQLVAE